MKCQHHMKKKENSQTIKLVVRKILQDENNVFIFRRVTVQKTTNLNNNLNPNLNK